MPARPRLARLARHACLSRVAVFIGGVGAAATAHADDLPVSGAVEVAVPVDVLLGDGLGAAVVTDAAAGVALDTFHVAVHVPVVARVDDPRVDLGNVVVDGGLDLDGGVVGVAVVLPTLWPAQTGARAQGEALLLATVGLGAVDAARFVPAATGAVVRGHVAFEGVTLGVGAGALASLAGDPVLLPVHFVTRAGDTEEKLAFYIGARLGSLIDTGDPLGSTLSATGELGAVIDLDGVSVDAGVDGGVFSSRDVSLGGVVQPRLVVRFGAFPD